MHARLMALPQFCLDGPELRVKYSDEALRANPAAFSSGEYRVLVEALPAPASHYRIRAVGWEGDGFESAYVSRESLGMDWPEALRAFSTRAVSFSTNWGALVANFPVETPPGRPKIAPRRLLLVRMDPGEAARAADRWAAAQAE